MKSVYLKPKKDLPVRRFHPWVFSGAIEREESGIREGDVVRVLSQKGEVLGTGHYQAGSIRVRLLSFREETIDASFWQNRLQEAWQYRQTLGLTDSAETDCFRLVHAEGDGLPGLIIDIYGPTAVIQSHTIGMYRAREALADALRQLPEQRIQSVYGKSKQTVPARFRSTVEDGYLSGEADPQPVREYGHLFSVDWEHGQKTGFFLDQRENRQLLASYAPGRKVLNSFCYTGGFSVYAMQAGAGSVDSVDISKAAIQGMEQNMPLNFPEGGPPHRAFAMDVMKYLAETEMLYDLIVVDPPAFAKSRNKRHNAVMAYKRLNAMAIDRLLPNGLLFTFSCSQVVDENLFYNTIVAAVLESGRQARIMHRLGQPADHPVSASHPEGRYLKGLVLAIA